MRSLFIVFVASFASAASVSSINTRDIQSLPKCTEKSPAPGGRICGLSGRYRPANNDYYKFTNYQTVASFADCIDLAAPPALEYGSFGYDRASGLCTFYPPEIGQHGGILTPIPGSNSIFYDTACFDCPGYKCPLLQKDINTIQDGGFEMSSQYIGPWQAYNYDFNTNGGLPTQKSNPKGISVVSPGSKSKNAIRIHSNKRLSILRQSFQSCPNEVYHITFDYMVGLSDPRSQSKFTVGFGDGSTNTILDTATTNGTWVTYQDLFTLGDVSTTSPSIWFRVDTDRVYNTPPLTLDNWTVSPVASLPVKPRPDAKSVLENGGFESGKLAPWIYSNIYHQRKNSYAIVSPGLGMTDKAFKFTAGSKYSGDFSLHQPIKLTKGARYIFSVNVAGGKFGPVITVGTREFSFMYERRADKTYSAPFIAQSDSTNFTIALTLYSPKPHDTVLVDNLSLKMLENL